MENKMNVVQLEEIIEVPDSHRECSVCGIFYEESEYKNVGENYISRTNCSSCWNLKSEEFKALKEKTEDTVKNSKVRKQKFYELTLFNNSISVEEMIQSLLKLPKKSRFIRQRF